MQRPLEHEATLVEEAYASTKAYMTAYSSSRDPLHVHISRCPVADAGNSDKEVARFPEDERCVKSVAHIESLSSVVVLVTAWVGCIRVSSGRAPRHRSDHKAMSKDPSTSNTPAESSTPPPAISDADLERLLNREASAIQRELEVDRILNAFKLKSVFVYSPSWAPPRCLYIFTPLLCSPYDILDLAPSVTAEGVKKRYRQLSLCELPLSTRNVELCSLMRGFLYVFND